MADDPDWTTVQQLADKFAAGKYHQVYHLIRKGALEATRPKPYRVRVTATSAALIFGPEVEPKVVSKP